MMLKIKRLLLISLILSCFFKGDGLFAQKINKFDTNKKRHGVWKKYYSNGRIRYIGKFNHGKEIGTFHFYDIRVSDYPIVIKKFDLTDDTAFVQHFSLGKKLRSEGRIRGRNRIGKWIYYFLNGKLFSEEFYTEGKLEGMLKNYYKNGQILEETEYKNGLKHGMSKNYSDSGVLLEEVLFENGKENGIAKFYDLKGNLKDKGVYKNGEKFGKWEFYMDGEVISEKEKKKLRKFKKKH